jgi:hypothetical protein
MTQVRVRKTGAWQDLAIVGPQGPQGPIGPQGPQGPAMLASGQIDCPDTSGGTAWGLAASGTEIGPYGTAGTDWRFSHTPSVDAWWDVCYRLMQIGKNVSGWDYCILNMELIAGSIPAVSGVIAQTAPVKLGRGIISLYGPGGAQYETLEARRRVPLSAGVAYTMRPIIEYSGSGWVNYTGQQHNPSGFWTAVAR